MTFSEVVLASYENKEFVANFDRLRGTNLLRQGSNLDLAIDKATGRQEAEMTLFIKAVWDLVWCRLPREEATTP